MEILSPSVDSKEENITNQQMPQFIGSVPPQTPKHDHIKPKTHSWLQAGMRTLSFQGPTSSRTLSTPTIKGRRSSIQPNIEIIGTATAMAPVNSTCYESRTNTLGVETSHDSSSSTETSPWRSVRNSMRKSSIGFLEGLICVLLNLP